MLMSVVFPEPEGPIRATHSPSSTAKLTPLSARSAPYCLIKLSMRTCCAAARGWNGIGATTLTLHLETPMPGGCSPAAAAGRRSESPPASSNPQLQDRQSDRKSTRLNSSHEWISYAVFCLKKKIHNL